MKKLKLDESKDCVLTIAETLGGKRVVTGSMGKTTRVWDLETGAELLKLEAHTSGANRAAVTPDGKRLVTTSFWDRTARVWDIETGTELLKLEGHTRDVNAVAIAPDGKRVVTGSNDMTARVWDMETGKERLKLEGHTEAVWAVAVSPDYAVTGSWDETVRVWHAETGAWLLKVKVPRVPDAVFVIHDANLIACCPSGVGTWTIWDARHSVLTCMRLVRVQDGDGAVFHRVWGFLKRAE